MRQINRRYLRQHISYINQAKNMGDYLIVLIATDLATEKNKGFHYNDENTRRDMVFSLKGVDKAVIGAPYDKNNPMYIFQIFKKYKIDVLALSFDDRLGIKEVEKQIKLLNLDHPIKVIPCKKYSGKIFDKYEWYRKFGKSYKNILGSVDHKYKTFK